MSDVGAYIYRDNNHVPIPQAIQTLKATDSQIAGVATATAAALTNEKIVATGIIASYSNATQAGTITVKDGSTTLFTIPFVGQFVLGNLSPGVFSSKDSALSMALSAGAGGVTGAITFIYFSVLA